jgi:nucleotidyltransferase/DNA polymerase involved in DNA repair
MRIACVHVPQFALQTLTRIDPSLRGAAVAVVGSGVDLSSLNPAVSARAALTSPVVQACSRAAWALGVRIGMTATAANATAPGQLRVVSGDSGLERETVRAIADALLGVSAVVDAGGRIGPAGAHLAMYCEVPSKTRGSSFGDKLVELLATLGLTARIGIADDRFTAWVAAAHGTPARRADDTKGHPLDDSGVVSVPRGGSAAFLSPRPLSLLAITPEVQHMLEALGVRTLGEFAALPAPSVARPIEADYQALARGDSGQALRPYAPEAPIREDIVLSSNEGGVSTSAAIAHLAERVAARLAGRGRGAARLEVTVSGASGDQVVPILPGVTSRASHPVPVSTLAASTPSNRRVIESVDELADSIGLAVDAEQASPWRMRVTVTGEAIAGDAASTASDAVTAESLASVAESSLDVLGVVLASTGTARSKSFGSFTDAEGSWRLTHPGDPRSVRDERRDAHRRTQRGKAAERRRVRDREFVQARLFGDRK